MYRVLLADDEPIILSGLQSMLDWEGLGCAVCGTARNGRQALELVEARQPDIVICDINMPLFTGLELLDTCAQRWPDIVFIMLTNHQDFHMAQQSLWGRAVDYLLKIELDQERLEQSMRIAIDERERRRKLFQPAPAQPELDPAEAAARQAAVPNISSFTREERARLFRFHRNLALDAAQKVFQGLGWAPLPPEEGREGTAVLFLWGLEDHRPIAQFQTRLAAAVREISQVRLSVLATGILSDRELAGLRLQTELLRREHALSPRPFLCWSQSMGKGDYIAAAKRYVEDHILERVLVQDVAAAIGITPNYLSSIFKRQLGQNFMDYVNATKVKHACSLLSSGKYLVYEVSHMLGYDNAYYFTKVFKRYMKVTPTEYQACSSRPPTA